MPAASSITRDATTATFVAALTRWSRVTRGADDFTRSFRPEPLDDDAQLTVAIARSTPAEAPALAAPKGSFDLDLGREIARGGMGRILLATQPSLQREVVVKTTLARGSTSATEALVREALILGTLEHPGIVPIHALGRDEGGRPLVIMKRIEGASLRELAGDRDHPLWSDWDDDSPSRLIAKIEILIRVCDAVHFANSRGIIHRDIKPANIMVGELGQVYLLDWGIAVPLDHAGSTAGSPAYMAPEMALGEPVDARTDVYLLGATLHHLLTGSARHQGESLDETLLAACYSEPFEYGPEVPEDLAELANRATAADPGERPKSALAFRRALGDSLRHRSSYALCHGAQKSLDELTRYTRDTSPAGQDAQVLERLSTEARFGFSQAKAIWPENPSAGRGHVAWARAMITARLARDDLEGARALLLELDAPDAAILGAIAALARRLDDKALEIGRLRSLDRDHDSSTQAFARRIPIAVLALFTAGMSAFLESRLRLEITPAQRIHAALAGWIVIAGVIAILRERLRQSAVNRGAALMLLMGASGWLAGRVLDYFLGTPASSALARDLILMSVLGFLVGALLKQRWALAAGTALLGGSAIIAAAPAHAGPIFGATTLTAALVALLLSRTP